MAEKLTIPQIKELIKDLTVEVYATGGLAELEILRQNMPRIIELTEVMMTEAITGIRGKVE